MYSPLMMNFLIFNKSSNCDNTELTSGGTKIMIRMESKQHSKSFDILALLRLVIFQVYTFLKKFLNS